jgi:hypothetical protein
MEVESSSPFALVVTPFGDSPNCRWMPAITVRPPILAIQRMGLDSAPGNRQTIGVQRLIGRTKGSWYGFCAHKSEPGGNRLGRVSDDWLGSI